MKFVLVSAVVPVLILTLSTSLNAASSKQASPTTVSDPSKVQSWEDHEKLKDLKDVLFDFDTHEFASEHAILELNAQWLKNHPNVRFRIAGYTDLRGEVVYNLALSRRRVETVKQELIRMGIAESRIEHATGWGELYPNCVESTEQCWAQQHGAMLGPTTTCRVSIRH